MCTDARRTDRAGETPGALKRACENIGKEIEM